MTGVEPLGPAGLKRILPHRYPMLLVDRVVELVPGERVTALKAVTANEPWYAGLGPDATDARHEYPPVLLVESWCQAAGVLAAWDAPNPDVLSGQVMLFGSMADIRIGAGVRPGEVVEHRVRLVRALSDAVVFEGTSVVGDAVVLDVGRVVMAMRPARELTAGPAESALPAPQGVA